MPKGFEFVLTWQFVTLVLTLVVLPFAIAVYANLLTPSVASLLKERTERQKQKTRKKKRIERAKELSELNLYSIGAGLVTSGFYSAIARFVVGIWAGLSSVTLIVFNSAMITGKQIPFVVLTASVFLFVGMNIEIIGALLRLTKVAKLSGEVAVRNAKTAMYRERFPEATGLDVWRYNEEEDRKTYLMTAREADIIANNRVEYLDEVLKRVSEAERDFERNQEPREDKGAPFEGGRS